MPVGHRRRSLRLVEPHGPGNADRRRIANFLFVIVAPIAIVLLPLSQYLRPGLWPNHPDTDSAAWAIAYTGRFFAVHGQFPVTLDSERFAGDVQPVFYAPILFPLLGLASNPIGALAAIRLAAVGIWLMQFLLVFRLAWRMTSRRFWAVGVATLVSWTIYPFNNLYHRGAVAEFLATSLLTCAVCAGGLAMLERRRAMKIAMFLLCAWCGALAAGAHSITAVLGGIGVGCMALAAMPIGLRRKRTVPHDHKPHRPARGRSGWRSIGRRRRIVLGLAAVVVIAVAPWLYVAARYGSRLEVAGKTSTLVYQPEHDSLWVRLLPFPINSSPDDYPHNNPQLNTVLLLVTAWSLVQLVRTWRAARGMARRRLVARWSRWGTLLRVSLVLLVLTVGLSTQSALIHSLPAGFSFVQYAYRLISHSNLAMLVALLAAVAIAGNRPANPRSVRIDRAVWAIAIACSAIGLGMKLSLAAKSLIPADLATAWRRDPDVIAHAPARFHAQKDYVVSDDARLLANEPVESFRTIRTIVLPIGTGEQFGISQPVEVRQDVGGWVLTSVAAFPWNQMRLDSQPAAPDRVREVNHQLAVYVPEGTHGVGYRPEPDSAWAWLRRIGLGAFAILSFATFAAWVWVSIKGALTVRRLHRSTGSRSRA